MVYSHEVHLKQKNFNVVEKINSAEFDPADYSNSLTQAALDKQSRFDRQTNATAPFADTTGCAQHYPKQVQLLTKKADIADKVNSSCTVVDAHTYSDNLELISKGKADRFLKASTSTAPYAEYHTGNTDLSMYPVEYQSMVRARKKGVMDKVNEQEFDSRQYQNSLSSLACGKLERYQHAVAAEAPFAVSMHHQDTAEKYPADYHARALKHKKEVQGKVNKEVFDSQAVSSHWHDNAVGAGLTMMRNRGIPNLLRHDE